MPFDVYSKAGANAAFATAAQGTLADTATQPEDLAGLTTALAEAAPLPHRFALLDDMLWPRRHESTGTNIQTAVTGNVHVKMFQATDDVVITGMSMASGSAIAASGQTLSRFALYHVGDYNPGGLATGRASFTAMARTDSDTTLLTALSTLYTRPWSTAGGWPAAVRLRRGEWYAAAWLLLGGVAPQVISSAANPRPQITSLGMATAGAPGGMGTCTELWPYWNSASMSYSAAPAIAWIGLTVDPASTLAPARPTVLLGDSFFGSYASWLGWGNAQAGAPLVPVNNAGVGGQQVDQMTARIATDVTPYAPEVVILHGGTNDIAASVSTATMQARYTACLDSLLAIPSVTDVIVCTPPPQTGITGGEITVLSEVRAWLLALNRPGVTVVDTGMAMSTGDGTTSDAAKRADTVHPNEAGSQAMADVLDDVLAAL